MVLVTPVVNIDPSWLAQTLNEYEVAAERPVIVATATSSTFREVPDKQSLFRRTWAMLELQRKNRRSPRLLIRQIVWFYCSRHTPPHYCCGLITVFVKRPHRQGVSA